MKRHARGEPIAWVTKRSELAVRDILHRMGNYAVSTSHRNPLVTQVTV
jgi:hypothetical protein